MEMESLRGGEIGGDWRKRFGRWVLEITEVRRDG